MTKENSPRPIAEVHISPPRRFVLLAVLFALGAVLTITSFTGGASFIGRIILLGFGLVILYQAEKMRRLPAMTLQLHKDGLYQSDGTLIAKLEEFKSVDRGALAFKPSNGFTINLVNKHERAWVPGLWWRFGRRVGVGGTASAGAAKYMAEQIAMMLAERH